MLGDGLPRGRDGLEVLDGTLLLDSLGTLAALLLALAALRLGTAKYAALAPPDAEAVPILHVLALSAGALLGMLWLLACPHLPDLAPSRVFAAEGPWAITLREFLVTRALPSGQALRGGVAALAGAGGPLGLVLGWGAVALALAGAWVAFSAWRGVMRPRALLAFLLLTLWTAVMLGYAVHLVAWAAAQLSFWLFLVVLVLFQRWRHRPRLAAH